MGRLLPFTLYILRFIERNVRLRDPRAFLLFLLAGPLSAGCGSVQSSVQSLVTGEAPTDETYAGRQHFPVTPQEAVDFLAAVAPQHGWEVVSTGDEYDGYGQRGKFFRIETDKLVDGKKTVSGVFYAEPSGAYTRISENNGLPEALVEPLIAEIKKEKGYK